MPRPFTSFLKGHLSFVPLIYLHVSATHPRHPSRGHLLSRVQMDREPNLGFANGKFFQTKSTSASSRTQNASRKREVQTSPRLVKECGSFVAARLWNQRIDRQLDAVFTFQVEGLRKRRGQRASASRHAGAGKVDGSSSNPFKAEKGFSRRPRKVRIDSFQAQV